MTEAHQKELQTQFDKGQLPTLTVANVLSTIQGLAGQVGTLLEESIVEVFDWLRQWQSPPDLYPARLARPDQRNWRRWDVTQIRLTV